jgi:Domain of Unknown Function (DUF1080)
VNWTARNWKLAGLVVVVIASGALIWSATERGERDDDEQPAGKAMAAAPGSAAPAQKAGSTFVYNFDSDATGQLPAKFHEALTGGGGAVKWVVQAENSAPSKPNVLAQTSADQADYRFPLAIADEGSFRDLDLSVKFKAVSGAIDRAAGLVFRLKDANNYYVVRANALEDTFNLYHVVNGSRQEIKGSQVRVSSGEWHELRVEAVGNKFTCYFDGDKKIEVADETFKDAGKIGVWTKADSVTFFDDLKVIAK